MKAQLKLCLFPVRSEGYALPLAPGNHVGTQVQNWLPSLPLPWSRGSSSPPAGPRNVDLHASATKKLSCSAGP